MPAAAPSLVALPAAALDRLMPMHMIVGGDGTIRSAGPTLAKLRPGRPIAGRGFWDVFDIHRPRGLTDIAGLCAAAGTRLSLRFKSAPATSFKGHAVALPDAGGLLFDLSFGIAAVEAVGTYRLTSADFPPTDLTVELLYLVEANGAVLGETRDLNRRLQDAMFAAEEQAYTDTLTGLRNRRAMDRMLARYTETGEPFGLMQIDLDYFKDVNDTFGHAAGDHVLQQVGRILREETRSGDTIARAGGDEFVLIFHRLTDRARLGAIAQRVLDRLAPPIMFGRDACRISASIGIAVSDDYDAPDAETMLSDADRALYASKKAGRARHSFVQRVA